MNTRTLARYATHARFDTHPTHASPLTGQVRFTGSSGLDDGEIASILALAAKIGGASRRAFGLSEGGLASPHAKARSAGDVAQPKRSVAQGHGVTYLHGLFESELPVLHAKLLACALSAHGSSEWDVIDPARLTVRTIEVSTLLGSSHRSLLAPCLPRGMPSKADWPDS